VENRILTSIALALAASADSHATQRGKETALTYAMTAGNRRVLESLLWKAPDLRLTDSWGGGVARILARLDHLSKQAEAAR
jgi:hypothetical protein